MLLILREHLRPGGHFNSHDAERFFRLQALFLFLYTGEIEFAPFGSDANRNSRNLNASNEDGKTMPKASPKSIYRLADKVI